MTAPGLDTFLDNVPKTHLSIHDDLSEVLITDEQIRDRVRELATEIDAGFAEEVEILIISIINGAIVFTADLIRQIRRSVQLDCIRASSYRDATYPSTQPEIVDQTSMHIQGRQVLLIDDIIDTGRTISEVVGVLEKMKPSLLKTCVLLDKVGRREVKFEPDFVGFAVPDEFVVGYGLDFAGSYRNLPCIGILKPDLQNPPEWGSVQSRK